MNVPTISHTKIIIELVSSTFLSPTVDIEFILRDVNPSSYFYHQTLSCTISSDQKQATSSMIEILPAPIGNYTIDIYFSSNLVNNPTKVTIKLELFDTDTIIFSNSFDMSLVADKYDTGVQLINIMIDPNVSFLHGDSLLQGVTGFIMMKEIKSGDEILTGDYQFTRVKNLVSYPMNIANEVIIIEPGSFGEYDPNGWLIIDPNHPIATREQFAQYGITSLKKAEEFLKLASPHFIYSRKWDNLPADIDGQLIGYDLVLEEPYKTYLANNIIVKSRKSVSEPGYLYCYDDFI